MDAGLGVLSKDQEEVRVQRGAADEVQAENVLVVCWKVRAPVGERQGVGGDVPASVVEHKLAGSTRVQGRAAQTCWGRTTAQGLRQGVRHGAVHGCKVGLRELVGVGQLRKGYAREYTTELYTGAR